MPNPAEKKDGPSFDEVMEKLKDPAILQAAATRMGLRLEAPRAPEKKKRELPKIELEEGASPEDLAKALNKGFVDFINFMQEDMEEKTMSVRQEVSQKESAKLAKEVRDFAKSKSDFNELLPMIEPFFNTGKYTIQEAYELGRKASGKTENKETKPEKTEVVTPVLDLSKTSEEDGTRSSLTAKPKSIKEVAKAGLEEILRKSENTSDALNDGDAL